MTNKTLPAVSYQQHPWTFRLIALNLLVYLLVEASLGFTHNFSLLAYGWFDPDLIVIGQWWRLVTSTLLHADFMHLLFNMIALLIFGSMLEKIVGGFLYLVVYFSGGILANLIVLAILVLSDTSLSSLGASGSIMAVIGSSFSCALYIYGRTKMEIWRQFFLRMAIILVLQLLLDLFLPNNSMLTHFIGGVSGIVLGYLIVLVKVRGYLKSN